MTTARDNRRGPSGKLADAAKGAEVLEKPIGFSEQGASDYDPGPSAGPKEGADIIRAHLVDAPTSPGVYRMIDSKGDVLYVGKAKSIKKRVTSYTQLGRLESRLLRMVARTRRMEFITTHTEAEALLLEANMIKRFRPPFNVLLRDDKSFPYIKLRLDHQWAQIHKHRGVQRKDGKYFGPFASAGAVNRTLNTLQKVFLLRSCSDSVFDNRTRPCLLYQIKRCSAPCVDRISAQDYEGLVTQAQDFLEGRKTDIQKQLSEKMAAASEALDFESAAIYRDRLRALAHVQQAQAVNSAVIDDADLIAAVEKGGQVCIQVFFYRAGQNWGNRAYFPRHDKSEPLESVLSAFLGQFYDGKPLPRKILVNQHLNDAGLLAEAFSVRLGSKVELSQPQRGDRRRAMEEVTRNAVEALDRRLAESATQSRLLTALADSFDLEAPPQRIEVYDNSHIQGSNAIGAMIVAGPDGFIKNQYRKFNIKQADAAGDDFAMMREVMSRRFSRLMKEDPDRNSGDWPDLLLIDGGKGQLSSVQEIMDDLGVDDVALIGISKGPDRNAGREQFHMTGRDTVILPPNDEVLYFCQRLRDEAHRFAIGTHRAKRAKDTTRSPLDSVAGIGPKRKKALLHHFGSAKAVAQAGVEDLQAVDGISRATAQIIYDHFHD